MRKHWLLCVSLLLLTRPASAAAPPKPTQQGLVYGKSTAGAALTMDYYAGAGLGPHPIAILLEPTNAMEAPPPDRLTAAGYNVFSLHDQATSEPANQAANQAANQPASQPPVEAVTRATRYVRFHAREWNSDGKKIALIGGPETGYLILMVGLINASSVMGSDDSIDRESARVQAVVAASASQTPALLEPLLEEKARAAALAQAPGSTYADPTSPAFLLIQSQSDPSLATTGLQDALRKVGLHCDVLQTANAREWQPEMIAWLNKTLAYQG